MSVSQVFWRLPISLLVSMQPRNLFPSYPPCITTWEVFQPTGVARSLPKTHRVMTRSLKVYLPAVRLLVHQSMVPTDSELTLSSTWSFSVADALRLLKRTSNLARPSVSCPLMLVKRALPTLTCLDTLLEALALLRLDWKCSRPCKNTLLFSAGRTSWSRAAKHFTVPPRTSKISALAIVAMFGTPISLRLWNSRT